MTTRPASAVDRALDRLRDGMSPDGSANNKLLALVTLTLTWLTMLAVGVAAVL